MPVTWAWGRYSRAPSRRPAVVPPERQEAVILDYLSREGFAYRQDIAQLLGIDPSQCRPILQRMVTAGQIVQERQRYLPRAAVIRKNP